MTMSMYIRQNVNSMLTQCSITNATYAIYFDNGLGQQMTLHLRLMYLTCLCHHSVLTTVNFIIGAVGYVVTAIVLRYTFSVSRAVECAVCAGICNIA